MEFIGGNRIGIGAVLVVGDEEATSGVVRAALLRCHGADLATRSCPDWRRLHIGAFGHRAVCLLEAICVDGVDIPVVVYHPIAGLAVLPTAPLAIVEAPGFQQQPHGDYRSVGPAVIASEFTHDRSSFIGGRQPIGPLARDRSLAQFGGLSGRRILLQ